MEIVFDLQYRRRRRKGDGLNHLRGAIARVLLILFGAALALLLLELALQVGAPLVRPAPRPLMTYPTDSPFYAAVNDVYRQFAADTGLPLIDLGAALAPWAAPRLVEKAYFPDFHPRRLGYEAAARLIAARLDEMVHGGGEAARP